VCFDLKELPSSFGQLNALQELHLQGCYNLKELPSSIGQLNALQGQNLNNVKWLCLKKCMIQKLPNDLFYWLQLQVFHLAQCQSLEEIPSPISQLNALQELDL
jgi:Leucine-rich repeat (LRR) protein